MSPTFVPKVSAQPRGTRRAMARCLRTPLGWGPVAGLALLIGGCSADVTPKNAGPGGGTAGAAGGGTGMPMDLSKGGPKLRVLTQAEYKNSLADLLGAISAQLDLPADTFVGGFTSIGGAEVAINASSVEPYETASRAVAAEVFADAARWQKLVGCQPQADLSDACVVSFVQSFGKRAFRRDLAEAEVQQWLQVGKDAAQRSRTPSSGWRPSRPQWLSPSYKRRPARVHLPRNKRKRTISRQGDDSALATIAESAM